MTPPSRRSIGLLLSLTLTGVAATSLHACADNAASSPTFEGGADAGAAPATRQSCVRTADCDARNEVCGRVGTAFANQCVPPSGRCDPEAPIEGQCYPDARCDLSVQTPDGQGNCSFQPPSRPVFPAVEALIALESPRIDTELLATSGFSFQWRPLRGVAGAVTVVMVTTQPPAFDPISGRITNHGDVVWAWSTAEPGNIPGDNRAVDGTVPVRFGRQGVRRDGTLGPAWGRDTMNPGAYWWFVYAINQGAVVATSVAQGFVVGAAPPRPQSCRMASQCVGPGELPELYECYQMQCRRRCASDLDCRAEGTTCLFDATITASSAVRRGAFCGTVVNPMTGDAGVSGDGPR